MDKLNIPKKLMVGFQNRADTYTGKLAYVVYVDEKGVLRKEKSWRGWIDSKIPVEEPNNEPISGFVLNRDVGGVRRSYGWDARIEKVRVYDPRGFEFEISIPNLLFILQECSAIKGKGLEGEFVYAWDGPELVLLPVASKEYQSSVEFTSLKKEKVSKKDLVPGCVYLNKNLEQQMYIGSFCMWGKVNQWDSLEGDRQYVFVDMKNTEVESPIKEKYGLSDYKFERYNDTKHVAKVITTTPDADLFSRLYTEFNNYFANNGISLGTPTSLEYSPLPDDKKTNMFQKLTQAASYYYRSDWDRYSKTIYLSGIENVTCECLIIDIGTISYSNRNYYYYSTNFSEEELQNIKEGKGFRVKVKGTLKAASTGIETKKSEAMKDKILYFSKEEISAMMMDVNVLIDSGKRINLIDLATH